jgi:hypothetical protein
VTERGEVRSRTAPTKSQLEARKKKDPRTPEGEISLASSELTRASKVVRGKVRGVKREMFSINYQNS